LRTESGWLNRGGSDGFGVQHPWENERNSCKILIGKVQGKTLLRRPI